MLPAWVPSLPGSSEGMVNPYSDTAATRPLVELPVEWEDRKKFIIKELKPDEQFRHALPHP